MIYLDNNATTRPAPPVIDAMREALGADWGNPSSTHALGRAARARVEDARESVATLIGAKARDVVFTAGGTESIHLAIRGVLALAPQHQRTIVTSAVEHEAVHELCEHLGRERFGERRWDVRVAPVDSCGLVDCEALGAMLDSTVALVSIQWANSETGVVQPVERIGGLCRERGVVFHCDGVQWVGKGATDVGAFPVDLLSLSAHKFHGPKGVGALWVRRGVRLQPILHGVQERETRAGTENVPGIVGMGVGAGLAREWLESDSVGAMGGLRDGFERALLDRLDGARVIGAGADRVWNTTSVLIPGVDAKRLVGVLSERGVMCSTGAACSSGSDAPSRTLLAMGLDEAGARSVVRLSLSRDTGEDEIGSAIEIIGGSV